MSDPDWAPPADRSPGAHLRSNRHAKHPRMLAAMQRQKDCLALRIMGMRTKDIAAQLGITPRAVSRAIDLAMQAHRDDIARDAGELRAQALARLDQLRRVYFPRAIQSPEDKQAFERVLKLEARQAALLGLDIKPAGPPSPDKPFEGLPDASKGGAVAIQINISADDARL